MLTSRWTLSCLFVPVFVVACTGSSSEDLPTSEAPPPSPFEPEDNRPEGVSEGDDPYLAIRGELRDFLLGGFATYWGDESHYDPDHALMQARRLWYFATMAQPNVLGCEPGPTTAQQAALRDGANRAFAALKTYRETAWRWSKDDDQTNLYLEAFALFGLSVYYGLSQNGEAKQLADETYREIMQHRAKAGGYFPEAFAPDFQTPLDRKNALGNQPDLRALNTHLHLLEAISAYYELVRPGEPAVAQELGALFDVLSEKIVDGRVYEFYDEALTARPPTILPGHNVELGFLLADTARVIGRPAPAQLIRDLLDYAHERRNPALGGLYHQIGETAVEDSTMQWWAQAEYLNALFAAVRVIEDAADTYLRRATSVWTFVRERFTAPEGVFYSKLDENGAVVDDRLHYEWKASYHTARALVFSIRALCPP
jgi:cellobiose epimerase